MFTFLDTWTDRTTDSQDAQGARPTPDFVTALMQEIRNGRKVARAERDTYFGTYKSVAEILGSANAVLDTLKKRQTDLVGALKDAGAVETSRERAVSTRIQDLHNKLAEATAQKQALEDKLVRLTNSHVPQPQLAELQGKLEDAETERFRVQTLLDLTVKSDFAHSV
jgi:ABC-type transporter Mla subunit MlaD